MAPWLALVFALGIALMMTCIDAWEWDGSAIKFLYVVMIILGCVGVIGVTNQSIHSLKEKRLKSIGLFAKYIARSKDFSE